MRMISSAMAMCVLVGPERLHQAGMTREQMAKIGPIPKYFGNNMPIDTMLHHSKLEIKWELRRAGHRIVGGHFNKK